MGLERIRELTWCRGSRRLWRDSPGPALAAQRFEAFERSFFVCPPQPRVARHIGGEDRGETFEANRRPELRRSWMVRLHPVLIVAARHCSFAFLLIRWPRREDC